MKKISALSAVLVFLFMGANFAWALPYKNDNRPYEDLYSGGSTPSGEPTLQEIFDSNITTGSLDVEDNQSEVGFWTDAEGDVSQYLVTMFKGDTGRLGIYNSAGNEYALNFGAGKAEFTINDDGDLWFGGTEIQKGFGYNFGFYWENTNPDIGLKFYTQDGKNTYANGQGYGYGPDENISALSYLVPEGHEVLTDAQGGKTVKAEGYNDWILAFEDRPGFDMYGTSLALTNPDWADHDFNDAVFYIEDMEPVPEPATILLFGAGLLGLAAYGRKKGFRRS